MHRLLTLVFLCLLLIPQAKAAVEEPQQESISRGLQMAKRVAALENGNDLPSRASVMSQRVARSTKEITAESDTGEKQPPSLTNPLKIKHFFPHLESSLFS